MQRFGLPPAPHGVVRLRAQVRIIGVTATYRWGDKTLDLHRCATCGCTTHWSPLGPASNRMGVNARLMDPRVIAEVRVRR